MFFRFGFVVVLLVVISLAGIAIEKQNLALRRSISLQEYRLHQLLEQRARLRLRVEESSAPSQSAASQPPVAVPQAQISAHPVDAPPLPRR